MNYALRTALAATCGATIAYVILSRSQEYTREWYNYAKAIEQARTKYWQDAFAESLKHHRDAHGRCDD